MTIRRGVLLLSAAILLGGGCRSGRTSEARLDRDAFIAVYVDLRRVALLAPNAEIDEEGKQAVLDTHGASEEDLLQFVDVHGEDTEYMAAVWAEVERRLAADRARTDSALRADPPST